MILYVASPRNLQESIVIDGEIASWFHLLSSSIAPEEGCDYQETCKKYFPDFSDGINRSFAGLNIRGDYEKTLDHMERNDFLFSGKLKEVNDEWRFEWRYKREIEYYFYNKKRNTEITLFKGLCRSIRHKEWFSKFSIIDNKLIISRTRSEDYWIFDMEKEITSYISARAAAGQAHGQYDLARMYLDGYLVQRNADIAKEWLEKSATQGFRRAQELLKKLT